jgi:CRP/FNR family transcriptional regulator
MVDSKLYKIPRNLFENYLKENADVSFDLLKRILRGVDGLLSSYNHLLTGESSTRVASALLIAAKRFGDKKPDGSIVIKLKLTHQDVANLSGMSRETASIAIEKLAKRGLLKKEKGLFVIKSMDELYSETYIENESLSSPTIL